MITLAPENHINKGTIYKVTDYEDFYKLYGYNYYDIVGVVRKKPLPYVRACIMKDLKEKGLTSVQIGKLFNRNHSTVLHSYKYDSKFDYDFRIIEQTFNKFRSLE